MYTRSDMRLLNSPRGLEYLLRSDKPDFDEVLNQLKFEQKLIQLQVKLINIQNRVVEKEERVMVLVEGREFAGKGDAIATFTEHLNPRSFRTVALQKPTTIQRKQWYFKRYVEQLPDPGEMVFFDRSWYNRAVVEPVNGFCSKKEYNRFMNEVNHFERMLIEDGIQLIKIYFSISKKEQKQRIEHVRKNPLRRWELTEVDRNAVSLWNKYARYERKMFELTNTPYARWRVFEDDNKRNACLQAFKLLLRLLK